MKFNLNDYKGNYAMHCKTEEEAENFCRFLGLNGRRWKDGTSYLEDNMWCLHERDTVYCFNDGLFCDVAFAKRKEGCTILEWSNFVEDSEIVSEFAVAQHK